MARGVRLANTIYGQFAACEGRPDGSFDAFARDVFHLMWIRCETFVVRFVQMVREEGLFCLISEIFLAYFQEPCCLL